jgi:biopolymer transport protein TolQ
MKSKSFRFGNTVVEAPCPALVLCMPMSDFPVVNLLSHMSAEGYGILAVLVLLSIVSLAVLLQKWTELARRDKEDAGFDAAFAKVRSFSDLPVAVSRTRGQGLRAIAEAALAEEETFPPEDPAGRSEATRVELVRETCEREAELQSTGLEVRLTWLVVAAGSGPFLGLLGTVWGIMDAFFRIGNQASAGLNVVAPGIAEALMTTGVGLLVALPSAAAHQILSGRIREIETRNAAFASRVVNLYRREYLAGTR